MARSLRALTVSLRSNDAGHNSTVDTEPQMRRILFTFAVLVALALPAASAARESTPNDGTLSVREARGIDHDPGPRRRHRQHPQRLGDDQRPGRRRRHGPDRDRGGVVEGAQRDGDDLGWQQASASASSAGTFRIVVKGRGINLSMVGKGNVTLKGMGTEDDGSYSVNGEGYSLIPPFSFPFPLSATSP